MGLQCLQSPISRPLPLLDLSSSSLESVQGLSLCALTQSLAVRAAFLPRELNKTKQNHQWESLNVAADRGGRNCWGKQEVNQKP